MTVRPAGSLRLRDLPGMTPAVPFMVAAVLLLPLADLGVALVAAALARGASRTYPVLAVNHLITLGWGTLLAMGSVHQLLPAMIGVPRRPGRAAFAQGAGSLAGTLLLFVGFVTRRALWIALGGSIVWIAVLGFLWTVLALLPQRRRWLPETAGVVAALAYLGLTVTWGLLMGVHWIRPYWRDLLTPVGVGVHAALGVGGWFAQLVVAVSYYLLPRFAGRRPANRGGSSGRGPRPGIVLLLLNAGVVALVAAAFTRLPLLTRAGAALLAVAALLYSADVAAMLRRRVRPTPDLTIHHWWAIVALTGVLAVTGGAWAAGILRVEGRLVAAAVVTLLLTGWLTLAIMGQLYKVAPFLMWYYRYGRGIAAAEVPRLPAPYCPRAGILPFYLTVAGSMLLAGGILVRAPAPATVGALALLGGAVVFSDVMVVSWVWAVLRGRAVR